MDELPYLIGLTNLAVSWGLLLLIWLVQIIIYPNFERIPAAEFVEYHSWYVKRIGSIVGPMMIVEAVGLVCWLYRDHYSPPGLIAAVLVLIIWLSTFTLQVPMHKRLAREKNETVIRHLVNSNWIRTIAWSIKTAVVSVAITYHAIASSS
jgi:hypothetical protein